MSRNGAHRWPLLIWTRRQTLTVIGMISMIFPRTYQFSPGSWPGPDDDEGDDGDDTPWGASLKLIYSRNKTLQTALHRSPSLKVSTAGRVLALVGLPHSLPDLHVVVALLVDGSLR